MVNSTQFYVKSIILNYEQDSFVRFDEYFQSSVHCLSFSVHYLSFSVHYLSFKNFDFIGFVGPSMYLQKYPQTKYLTIIDINDFWLILA